MVLHLLRIAEVADYLSIKRVYHKRKVYQIIEDVAK